VAIEQSVTFDTAEIRIPLEGPAQGNHVVRGYDVGSTPPAPVSHMVRSYDVGPTPTGQTLTPQPNPTLPDHLGPHFEGADQPCRSGQVRVESAYIKSLRDGTGTTDGHSTDLP